MKCLCCGKPITNSATNVEKEWCWHKKCVKRFFQTDELPILDITKEQLEILANETVNEGLTVPGVQKKLSLHLSTDLNARLTIVDYPTGYILKPQTEEFDNMPEFEDLAMRLAEIMGIQTVPHALIKMNDEYAYITKRIDREISEKETKLYAMEDFCQLSYRLTQDKYKGSYEQCGRIIKKCSATPGLDLSAHRERTGQGTVRRHEQRHPPCHRRLPLLPQCRRQLPRGRHLAADGAFHLRQRTTRRAVRRNGTGG